MKTTGPYTPFIGQTRSEHGLTFGLEWSAWRFVDCGESLGLFEFLR